MCINVNQNNTTLNITPTSLGNSFNTPVDSLIQNYSSLSSNNLSTTAPNISGYSSTDGYGLVNAGEAVSTAAGQTPYASVPALGGNSWGADLIKAPEAWSHGYTGQGVVVAVLDTGVDYNDQDLKNNIWTNPNPNDGYANDIHGWNFVDNNNNVLDDNGHGTHVSGIIAAENNNSGVIGVAYNTKIMPVKVLDQNGSGSLTDIAAGIDYAVNHGANVINMSLGGNSSDSTLQSAIDYANSKGVTVVMAAGNDGAATPDYPAIYATTSGIAVGAVDQNNQLADFSNRSGSQPITYLTAPGVDVYSTLPNNQFATYSGTSMATPFVTGAIALMLSANHNLTTSQIRDILIQTAENSTDTPASPTPSSPSSPSLFPSLGSLLPISLISNLTNLANIGSLFSLPLSSIGSLFPLPSSTTPSQSQSQSIQLSSVIIPVTSSDGLSSQLSNLQSIQAQSLYPATPIVYLPSDYSNITSTITDDLDAIIPIF